MDENRKKKKCGNFIWMDWFKTFLKRLEKSLGSVELLKNAPFKKCSLLTCLVQCKIWDKKFYRM